LRLVPIEGVEVNPSRLPTLDALRLATAIDAKSLIHPPSMNFGYTGASFQLVTQENLDD